MSVNKFEELYAHFGHDIRIAVYAIAANVAIECLDCNETLIEFDKEDKEKDE